MVIQDFRIIRVNIVIKGVQRLRITGYTRCPKIKDIRLYKVSKD